MRVMQIGLGAIGQSICRLLSRGNDLMLAGAADPQYAGRSLADLASLDTDPDITIADSIAGLALEADAAVLATASSMEAILPQVLALVERGWPVVSTCEELVYPWTTHLALAEQIDTAANRHGVAVFATGVNPGFMMDFFPVVVARLTSRVDRVTVERIQDAGPRRAAFQRKIGIGLTLDQFAARQEESGFGHAGLAASAHLLAAGLGLTLDSVEETIAPVTARSEQKSWDGVIAAGQVAGVLQECRGHAGGREVIHLIFRAALGEPESYDRVRVEGPEPLTVRFEGGVPGDSATAAIIVNALPLVWALPPGLRTMADLWPRTGAPHVPAEIAGS